MEYKNKKEHKKERQEKKESTRKILEISLWVIAIGIVIGVVFWVVTLPKLPQTEIISNTGVHWHPHLSIKINGENIEIPANIGIGGAVHNPMHTHEADGIIHAEYSGVVREKDLTLGNFFKIWGKTFNSNEIMGNIDGEGGKLKMLVNGVENKEFDKYVMKDNDNIEIIFE